MSTAIERQRGQVLKVYPTTENNSSGKLWRLFSSGFLLAVFFFFLIFWGLPALTHNKLDTGADGSICGISVIMSGALIVWYGARTWIMRIVVRDKGLEIHHHFRRSGTFLTWENLSHIEIVKVDRSGPDGGGGIEYQRVLYLKYPIGKRKSIDIGQVVHMDYLTYSAGRWFNTKSYSVIDPTRLVDSSFGQDLLRYAPHVIEAAKQEKIRIEAIVAEAKSSAGK